MLNIEHRLATLLSNVSPYFSRRDGPSKNSINRINQVINRILDRPTPTNGKDSTMMMMMMLMMSQKKNTKLKTDTKLKNETGIIEVKTTNESIFDEAGL